MYTCYVYRVYIVVYVYRIYILCLFIWYVYVYINNYKMKLDTVRHHATRYKYSFNQNILRVKRQKEHVINKVKNDSLLLGMEG